MVLTDATARGRLALVVALAGVASLAAVVSLAPAASGQSLLALAALTAATVVVARCPLLLPHAAVQTRQPRARAAAVPLVLAGRTTDVAHQPVRPRAPGHA